MELEKRIDELENRVVALESKVQEQTNIREIDYKIKILQVVLILVPISIIALNIFFLRSLY